METVVCPTDIGDIICPKELGNIIYLAETGDIVLQKLMLSKCL